jgi:hypothetical protein
VDAHIAAAPLDVPLEGALLGGVEDAVKAPASSVASTAKTPVAPSSLTAAIPSGIESCRKPAVFEKTSTRLVSGPSAPFDAAGPDTQPRSRAAAAPTVSMRSDVRMTVTPRQLVVKVKSSTS